METTLQERRRINDAMERLFLEAVDISVEILTFDQTDRGIAILDLYEKFIHPFSGLVMISGIYPQMRDKESKIMTAKARAWIRKKCKHGDDAVLKARCLEGVELFEEYAGVLVDSGIIVPPSKG